MKCIKSAAIFTVLFLLLTIPANSQNLSEYRMKNIVTGEILRENTDVLDFFRSLETKERDLLNSALQENYLLGYYTEIFQISKDAVFAEHLSRTKERLQTIKEGGLYQIILHKARGGVKTHLLRYIVRRYEAGTIQGGAAASRQPIRAIDFFNEDGYWEKLFFGKAYARVSNEHWTPLDPKEVFPVVNPTKKSVKRQTPFKPDNVNEKEIVINWSAIGKVSLVSVLILLAAAAIIALIGACCCPHLPVFKPVRKMLEYERRKK